MFFSLHRPAPRTRTQEDEALIDRRVWIVLGIATVLWLLLMVHGLPMVGEAVLDYILAL